MKLILFLIDIRLITYTIFNTSFKASPQVTDLRHGVSSIDIEKGHILLDNESFLQKLIVNYNILSKGKLTYSIRLIDLLVAIPSIFVIWRAYDPTKAMRYVAGLMLTLMTQQAFISAMIHVIGTEQSSLADALTLNRGANGAVLAGLVTSGIRERKGIAGWIGWLMPGWCLLPPIIHYLEPLLALMQGKLPQGGGPWWYRLAGASQMGLLIVALAPFDWRQRKQFLTAASFPVSIGQCTAIFVRLAMILKHNRGR